MTVPRAHVPPASRRCAGYTILEVLIALSLLGVLLLASFSLFNTAFQGMLAGKDIQDTNQNARLVLEWMVRRIRMAGFGLSANETELFVEAAPDAVTFRTDRTSDDDMPEYNRFCRADGTVLVVDGASVQPTGACAGDPLSSRGLRAITVTGLTFRYFDAGNTELPYEALSASPTDRAKIRRVRIVLDVARGPDAPGTPLRFTMDAVVRKYRF
ncbi:MAG: prepilin-type N-terminal cleavage/methylation domain-containing protein [Armatimonadota bacterium]|nr:prepilin-type N-terminal cleavage/methylation domain-containing protein [Armatimonadota bacterium]